jgi:hypothetical protein
VLNVYYGQILRKQYASSRQRTSKEEKNSLFRMAASTRKGNRLNKNLHKYQPQEELYSFEAPGMAREFREDRSDSDDP